MIDQEHFLAFFVTMLTVVIVVMLHYEAFIVISRLIGKSSLPQRRRILFLIFGLLIVHVTAIWAFGISAWWLAEYAKSGVVTGYDTLSFLDYIFMSAVTYTTLGYGDMIPLGPIRFLYGTQGLVGFLLVTWSASFTFLEMQRHWNQPASKR